MEMDKKKLTSLIFCVMALILCLTIINYLIEVLIKLPFNNNLTHSQQLFYSPASIVFFTSGFIWVCGSVYNCINSQQTKVNQQYSDAISQQQKIIEHQFDQYDLSNTQKSIKLKHQQPIFTKQQQFQFNQLSSIQKYKIVIPNFLQLLCFLYAISYLSFPKVLVFKIISRVGLTTLYESLFTQESNKCIKFMTSIVTFLGFGLFNFFLVDSSQLQKDQKLYKNNVLYGYTFVFGMCYLGLIKKIFQKQIYQKCPQSINLNSILFQSKFNCILSYLIILYFKQEIYGPVFAILHFQFLIRVLTLTLFISIAFIIKIYLIKNFILSLGFFICTLQKNISLILSVIIFGEGTNSGQIFGVCIIAIMAFINFSLSFIKTDETRKIQNVDKKIKQSSF